MPPAIDQTNDPNLRSWVISANAHPDFPIQNLPFGVFAPPKAAPRGGVAIGNEILDLKALSTSGLLSSSAESFCRLASGHTLKSFLSAGSTARALLRSEISALLAANTMARPDLLHRAAGCELLLPAHIGDYTDFYAGIHHAQAVGKLFRPDNPLLPNYKWVPIGYHGRNSSIRPTGVPVRRPNGQRKTPDDPAPTFGPARNLDFELEVGIWVGPGNDLGQAIPITHAADHIAGFCLLNDWSARDLQSWEYQPLGPFLAKSFGTTLSPWIITPEALAPFRQPQPPRPSTDPQPLPYLYDLADQQQGALNLNLEALLLTPTMRAATHPPFSLSKSNAMHLYWTPAQLLTHHASNGCNLKPGDLLGTGTISGPDPTGCGSLLELTRAGRDPLTLPNGEQRRFLEDGDEVLLRARAVREGYISIGFGDCRATIAPAIL